MFHSQHNVWVNVTIVRFSGRIDSNTDITSLPSPQSGCQSAFTCIFQHIFIHLKTVEVQYILTAIQQQTAIHEQKQARHTSSTGNVIYLILDVSFTDDKRQSSALLQVAGTLWMRQLRRWPRSGQRAINYTCTRHTNTHSRPSKGQFQSLLEFQSSLQ